MPPIGVLKSGKLVSVPPVHTLNVSMISKPSYLNDEQEGTDFSIFDKQLTSNLAQYHTVSPQSETPSQRYETTNFKLNRPQESLHCSSQIFLMTSCRRAVDIYMGCLITRKSGRIAQLTASKRACCCA